MVSDVVSNTIAQNFKDFLHSQDGYDPFEVACVVHKILHEQPVVPTHIDQFHIGIRLFDEGDL